jgi:fido (protein-threonine AMPylation protein)
MVHIVKHFGLINLMDDSTKIEGTTYPDDISGFKLSINKAYTKDEIFLLEAQNISKAYLKYFATKDSSKNISFTMSWLQELHNEMMGDVWDWASKFRQVELSIGVKAYLVSTELKKLVDDINFWHEHKVFGDSFEIAARIHHRAVFIHPFFNGNGRWARMLANIYLAKNKKLPTK